MKNLNIEVTTTNQTVGNLVATETKTKISIHAWSTAFTSLFQNGVLYVMPVTEMELNTSHLLRASIGDVVEFKSEEGGHVTVTFTTEGAQAVCANSKLKATFRKNEVRATKYIAPVTGSFTYPKWW